MITKKLEEFYPDLLPDTYLIHSEGGWHPWKNVQEASSIYRVKIWPYIQRIHWREDAKDLAAEWRKNKPRPEQLNLNMSLTHVYPYCTLEEINNGSAFIRIHIATGRAFLPNPENKNIVMHLNDDPSNWLLHNLKMGTNKENAKDRGADSKMTDSTMHAIYKMRGWAKG
jgi:hypothetical protein